MSIGTNIKNVRLHRNYTQRYMAQTLGTSQANYGKMENGMIGIAPERMEQIAAILDVALEEIVDQQEIIIIKKNK